MRQQLAKHPGTRPTYVPSTIRLQPTLSGVTSQRYVQPRLDKTLVDIGGNTDLLSETDCHHLHSCSARFWSDGIAFGTRS